MGFRHARGVLLGAVTQAIATLLFLFLFSALAAHGVFFAVFPHQTRPCKQSSPPSPVPFPKKHNVRRPNSASHTWSLSQRSRKRPLFSSLTICARSHFRGLFAHGRFSSVLTHGRFFDVFSQTVAFLHTVALAGIPACQILHTYLIPLPE